MLALSQFVCHTLNTTEEERTPFYHDLQSVVDCALSSNLFLVFRNWNACTETETKTPGMSSIALGTRCDNSDRLVNFATTNHLVVTNIHFQHPHLIWRSNDYHMGNQMDYILVCVWWTSFILDCHTFLVQTTLWFEQLFDFNFNRGKLSNSQNG